MSRSFANSVVAVAAVVTIASLLIPERSAAGAVVLAAAVISAWAVLWIGWGDPSSRNARAVALFILLVGGSDLLSHNHYANRWKIAMATKDAATLKQVAVAIEQDVVSTGEFPEDFDSMLRRYAIPAAELKSPITREADPKAPPAFELLDSETGFFRRGDFIWVYTDLDPADYAAHIIGFDVDLDRPGRVVVYGGAKSEIVLLDAFPTLIAQENRRRADRGLKPISNEITQITAEKR